jgi:hypothetical protein
MVVAAMTAHSDVVAWCVRKTAARPWIVAKALVCHECSVSGSCTLSHMCEVPDHKPREGWATSALLAACCVGDLSLVRRLMRDHVECDAGVRHGTMRDEVSVVMRAVLCLRGDSRGQLTRCVVVCCPARPHCVAVGVQERPS